MFDHKHYVPILKSKTGERWALSGLSPEARVLMTPLIELHPHKTADVLTQTDTLFDALAVACSGISRVFIDTHWLYSRYGVSKSIETAFAAAREYGVNSIPVFSPASGKEGFDAIHKVAKKDGRGFMVRMTTSQLNVAGNIVKAGFEQSTIDLMIDYGVALMTPSDDLGSIAGVDKWRTLTTASGSFPGKLSGVYDLNKWHSIPRSDWTSWLDEVTKKKLVRKPAYSDYATRPPGKPADFGDPRVNIRYTIDDQWKFLLAGRLKDGAANEMFACCKDLVKRKWYSTASFSSGDAEYAQRAVKPENAGNATSWVAWSMSHHLEWVIMQLATHGGI